MNEWKLVFPTSPLSDGCSRLYVELSYCEATRFQIHSNKHNLRNIANFANSKGTSQGPLQNKEVSINQGVGTKAAFGANANTMTLKTITIKEPHGAEDLIDLESKLNPAYKLSQDPGRGSTSGKSVDQKTSTHQ